jgi:SAM-dependent methyltransferase
MIHDCVFESKSELYTNGWKAYDFCKAIPETTYPKKTLLHFYWRVPRDFDRKPLLALKAAIISQNLQNMQIVLWSNVDLTQNELIAPLLRHIRFCIYDPIKEAVGTPLEGSRLVTRDDDNNWLGGDLFRLLILYKYGGVYVDCDMVLLRDLAPLLEQEFMYQWGTETDKINGAIMRMFAGSQLAADCLTMLPKMPAGFNSTDWGSTLYGEVRKFNKNWTVFPCAFFNTEWQLFINMGESAHPFKNRSDSNKMFPGAFAWHWHNKWDAEIEEGSKFTRLEKTINQKYSSCFNYIVNHSVPHLGGNYGGGDPGTFFPALWHWLIETLKIETVLDVGCGEGFAVQWFLEHGIRAMGIDGLPENIQSAIRRNVKTCFLCDLTKTSFEANPKADLIWCCEVVEHIEEKFIPNLIKTFQSGKYVAMTHAMPGQEGWHHVNCQGPLYWMEKMEESGFKLMPEITAAARKTTGNGSWFDKSGMVFGKKRGTGL